MFDSIFVKTDRHGTLGVYDKPSTALRKAKEALNGYSGVLLDGDANTSLQDVERLLKANRQCALTATHKKHGALTVRIEFFYLGNP